MFFNKSKGNTSINSYYMGDGCFNSPGLYESFYLKIIGEIKVNGYSDLYLCNLCYSRHDLSSKNIGMNIYYRLVVGFDKERMVDDSKYTRFLFDRILNRKNLMKITDFNYDSIDSSMGINYIGSVLAVNDNLVFYYDDNIKNIVNISFGNGMQKSNNDINYDKRKRAIMSSINRQGKVLQKKLEK